MSRRPRVVIVASLGLALLAATGCDALRVRTLMRQGNELYRAQKFEEAIEQYKQILEMDATHWDASYLTAVSYLALYHPGSMHDKDREYAEKAIAAFERCLEIDPPNDEQRQKVQQYYLSILTSAQRSDKAAEYLEGLLAKNPRDVQLVVQLATLYGKMGNFPRAVEYYRMRTEIEPGNKEAWYTVGVVCWDRSYHGGIMVSNDERQAIVEEGLAALHKALELDPDYFDALSYTNLLYREKGKSLQALGRYQEAGEQYLMADEFQKRALEARKKLQEAAPRATGG